NLGNAYRTLAEVESKSENCKLAIGAYEEALGVYTEKNFPQVHQLIMGNLVSLRAFCEGEQI
ncbi:MAG: hypothetical protein KAX39_08665, partial [candidate division Zixibacteria bacterium]|nr:hypothetical protein [candidate division Zixibacteria bacterium]